MIIEVPYELYLELKNKEGVAEVDIHDECLTRAVEFVFDMLDINDDEIREELLDKCMEEFYDDDTLIQSIKKFILDRVNE